MSIVTEETFVDDDEKEADEDEKQYSILVTSCNMESVIFFCPKNIICDKYTNVSVKHFPI